MQLYSPRLQLRLIEYSDLNVIHELHSLAETDEFNALGIPENIEQTKDIITPWILDHAQPIKKNYTFAIEQTMNKQFVGLIALKIGNPKYKRAEVWYKLHLNYWGQGFATEALSTLLDFSFNQLQLHRIEAGCAVNNIGSIKVLEKVGMIREGRKRQVLPLKSGWSDNYEYSLLNTDIR